MSKPPRNLSHKIPHKIYAGKVYASIALLAGMMCCSSIANGKNVALLVGISDYKTLQPDLHGASNDAVSLKNALIQHWNFSASDITLLTDAQATQANIIKALQALESKSSAGDEVLIYFSGHGTSIYDRTSDFYNKSIFLSKNSGAFIPHDYNDALTKKRFAKNQFDKVVKEQLITGQYHLRPILTKLDKDRKITAIIDSCYSENSFRTPIQKNAIFVAKSPSGLSVSKPRKRREHVTSVSVFNDGNYPYNNTITLSASSKAQIAADIQDGRGITLDNKPHGLFTDMLLRVLTNQQPVGEGVITYAELEQAVENMKTTYSIKVDQTPKFQPMMKHRSIIRQQDIMNRPLFGRVASGSSSQTQVINPKLKIKISNGKQLLQSKINGHIFEVVNSGLIDFALNQSAGEWMLTAGNGQKITRTTDFNEIVHRLQSEYWLKELQATVKNKTQASFHTSPEEAGNSFDAGDQFQLLTKFDRNSAVLMFNINNKGQINIIYPFYPHENIMHQANTLIRVPDKQKLDVTAPYGLEKMVMVTLDKPISDTQRNQISVLQDVNDYTVTSVPIDTLTDVIKQSATSISTINLQTFNP